MENKLKTFIFVGRSGAGKGTQMELLKEYISKANPVDSIVMGDIFRAFFKEDGYAQQVARELSMTQGKFQPDFLTNSLFINQAIRTLKEENIVFIDGFPRSIGQFDVVKQLLKFLNRDVVTVINVEVSRESVKERMLKRGRGDDSESAIDSRLDEYDRAVVPAIEVMKNDPFVNYIEIDGEPTVEEIHENLKKALSI